MMLPPREQYIAHAQYISAERRNEGVPESLFNTEFFGACFAPGMEQDPESIPNLKEPLPSGMDT